MEKLNIEREYKSVGYEVPLEGLTSQKALRQLSFADVLSMELLSRLPARQKVEMLKSMFVLLARSQNDDAAIDAIKAGYFFMVPTGRSSPHKEKITPGEYFAKVRKEKLKFLVWLESVYWSLPLYEGGYWEERTNGFIGYYLRNALPRLKSKVVGIVASDLWGGLHDKTGLRAFDFLLASANSGFFHKRAPEVTAAIREYKKKHNYDRHSFVLFALPQDEIKMAIDAIRQSAPKTVSDLQVWIAKKDTLPVEVWKIFAHAYVNAGGEIRLG